MQTVLAKIVADKAIWVEARKQQQPLASFQNDVVPSSRRFYDALQGARTAFILECKKRLRPKALFVTISTRRVLPAFISIMRQPSPC
jgi:indole-3-glycerol phosphate synthase